MLVKKGDPLPKKWNAFNVFGNTEKTPRHERMNPINKIPDNCVCRFQNGFAMLELSTGEIYKFSMTPDGIAEMYNTISYHLTYKGYSCGAEPRSVIARVENTYQK